MEKKEEQESLIDSLLAEPTGGEATAPESQPESEKKEEPAPSQEEQTTEATEPKSEDPAQKKEVPFHKHPRWIRREQEIADLKAQLEAERSTKQTTAPVIETPGHVPAQFQKLFGDDVEAYKEWQTLLKTESRKEAESIIEQRQQAEKAQKDQEANFQTKAVSWAEDQFIDLADETGIDFSSQDTTERNQVLDIIVEYGLYDENGMPKIKEANKLREKLYPAKADGLVAEKKSVLTKTATKTSVSSPKSDVWTPSKIREAEKRGGLASLLN
jgi:hypothetical protein